MSARRTGSRLPVGLGAALLVATPVLVGVAYSAAAAIGLAGAGAGQATTAHLTRVFGERATWTGLAWSLWVAGLSTLLATVGAVGVTMAFRRSRLTDRLGRALATVALPIPHLVAALLGLWVLGQSGMLARLARAAGLIAGPSAMPALVYDRYGIGLALAITWKELAFLTIVASALLATRAADTEETARTLGAGRWATFRRVTWPVLWRGLAPAVVAVFVFAVGNWEMAALLAPSDPLALPLLLADRAADPDLTRRGDAHVVALLLFGVGAAAVLAHEWARARWDPLDA